MAEKIIELFGYSLDDHSSAARTSRQTQSCPMIGGLCSKQIGSTENRIRSGVCTITDKDGLPVIICPIRLYAEQYSLLSTVAKLAFKVEVVKLVDGRQVERHPGQRVLVVSHHIVNRTYRHILRHRVGHRRNFQRARAWRQRGR